MFKMVVGSVPQEKEHHIATTFLGFIGPLIPVKSMYVTHQDISQSAGATTYHAYGHDLPVQWDSALLGYLRVWLAWATVASPFFLFWGESLNFDRPEWGVTIGLGVTWIATLVLPMFIQRIGSEERRVLSQATGLSIEPRRFGPIQLAGRREALAYEVEALGMNSTSPATFTQQAKSANPNMFPTLYAYARYAAAADAKWKVAADDLWKWRRSSGV